MRVAGRPRARRHESTRPCQNQCLNRNSGLLGNTQTICCKPASGRWLRPSRQALNKSHSSSRTGRERTAKNASAMRGSRSGDFFNAGFSWAPICFLISGSLVNLIDSFTEIVPRRHQSMIEKVSPGCSRNGASGFVAPSRLKPSGFPDIWLYHVMIRWNRLTRL